MNKNPQISPENFYKSTNIVFLGIIGGLAAVTIFFYLNQQKSEFDFNVKDSKFFISAALTLAAIPFSSFMYSWFKKKITAEMPLSEKFAKYQTASLVRFALLELTAFLIIFFLQDSKIYFVFPFFIVVYMIFLKPSKEKMMDEMNLSPQERHQLK